MESSGLRGGPIFELLWKIDQIRAVPLHMLEFYSLRMRTIKLYSLFSHDTLVNDFISKLLQSAGMDQSWHAGFLPTRAGYRGVNVGIGPVDAKMLAHSV